LIITVVTTIVDKHTNGLKTFSEYSYMRWRNIYTNTVILARLLALCWANYYCINEY